MAPTGTSTQVDNRPGRRAEEMARQLRRSRRRRLVFLTGLVLGLATAVDLRGSSSAIVVLGLACVLAAASVVRVDPRRWQRGAAGERETAWLLERLPPRRWNVWHDLQVPFSRANIDHLAVGPTGVWVIDTKTTRSSVRADRRGIRLGDRRLDTAPTRWEADRIAELLRDELPWKSRVRPVVALHVAPGVGLQPRGVSCDRVRVVPADSIDGHLRRGRRRLRGSRRKEVVRALEAIFGPSLNCRRGVDR